MYLTGFIYNLHVFIESKTLELGQSIAPSKYTRCPLYDSGKGLLS